MTDRYQQLHQLPARPLRRRAARPARSRRRCAATSPDSRCSTGPALLGAAPGGRLRDAGPPAAARRAAPSVATAPTRTPATARWCSTPPGIEDSADLRAALRRSSTRSIRSLRAERPACSCSARRRRRAATPREATAQRALEGFVALGRQGVRPGRHRPAGLRRARRRGQRRVHAALPALGRARPTSPARSSAIGAGAPSRPGRLGAPAGRPGRAGHRRRARHRRGDRRRCSPATARRWSASTCPPPGEALAAIANGSAAPRCSSTSPPRTRRRRSPTHLRERHGGVDIVVHNAGITRDKTLGRMTADALGRGARRQPVQPGADQRRAARATAA